MTHPALIAQAQMDRALNNIEHALAVGNETALNLAKAAFRDAARQQALALANGEEITFQSHHLGREIKAAFGMAATINAASTEWTASTFTQEGQRVTFWIGKDTLLTAAALKLAGEA